MVTINQTLVFPYKVTVDLSSDHALAIQHAEIGLASTLIVLTPVIILPISYLVFKEKVGRQAIVGTLFAIAGVAVLSIA